MTVKEAPALTYSVDPSAVYTGVYSSGISSNRLPLEIRLNVSVECSVDEIPYLAPKIRQLIRDLTAVAVDDSTAE